jgi:hypothetical protein
LLQGNENKKNNFENYYAPWDRWFDNRMVPTKEGLVVFFQDITERKLAKKSRNS